MRQSDSQAKRFTGGQMKLEKILNDLGFSTVLELEIEEYRVDVFVPELKCCFEHDGKGFHMKRRDQYRDSRIKELTGYKVIRISGKNLSLDFVKQRIAEEFDATNDAV